MRHLVCTKSSAELGGQMDGSLAKEVIMLYYDAGGCAHERMAYYIEYMGTTAP